MRKLVPLLAALALAGCAHHDPQIFTETKLVVIQPDPRLLNCPVVEKLPNPDTLQDVQVAGLVADLWENNHICKNNMDGIKQFLDSAEKKTSP